MTDSSEPRPEHGDHEEQQPADPDRSPVQDGVPAHRTGERQAQKNRENESPG